MREKINTSPQKDGVETRRLAAGEILTTLIFYLAILFFFIGFNFTDRMAGNWYQQFLPSIGSRQITDIAFLDSLNGYAVATQMSDTSYILKTSNRGDNWQIVYRNFFAMTKVQFLDINTGYACGGYLYKTINGGLNWTLVNTPSITAENMFVLNQNTIWIVWSEGATGGVFLTTNGGVSWQQQVNLGGNNPDRIYMFNARIGFISRTNSPQLRKTTNGGVNWNLLSGTGTGAFSDIYFIDSLTGWKARAVGGGGWLMGKTTDGGINWIEQILPSGGNISNGSGIVNFVNVNKDTIWGVGGNLFFPIQGARAFMYRTTNSGDTWYFQIPDTSYQLPNLNFIDFKDKNIGWAYRVSIKGIHTTNGGDTTFYLPVTQISSEVPKDYILGQNYPNPFNPETNIKYQIINTKYVKLKVFDIAGKEIITLVDEKQSAGSYLAVWNASGYASGVYFYSLLVDGKLIDTKKMLMIK